MRRWLIKTSIVALLFLAAGCRGETEVGSVPTGRPVIPTRVLPTATEPAIASSTSSPTETFALPPTEVTPSSSPAATETLSPSVTASGTGTPTPSPTINPSETLVSTSSPTATELPPTVTASPTSIPIAYLIESTAYQAPEIVGSITFANAGTGTLSDDAPAVVYIYAGTAGQTIDISLTASGGNLDPLLLVLSSKGEELARNDDISADLRDSGINGLKLPEDDVYYIVVTRYLGRYGFSEGEYALTVSENTDDQEFGFFSERLAINGSASGTLSDDRAVHFYTFRARTGDVIDAEMSQLSGDLDPYLGLTDNLGNLLITDDDVGGGSVNALIDDFVIPRDGYYTLVVTRFNASTQTSSGDYELNLSLVSRGGFDGSFPIDAILDPQNSRTIRSDGRLVAGFVPGDMLDDNDRELRLQALLTFVLPPGLTADQITGAALELAPCYATGEGLSTLGELTLYQDSYGRLDQERDYTRPMAGARIITTLGDCDPIDITDVVRETLDFGADQVQLRFTFRDMASNEEADQLRLTDPRLRISFNP